MWGMYPRMSNRRYIAGYGHGPDRSGRMYWLLPLCSGMPKRSDSICGDRFEAYSCPFHTGIAEQPTAPTGRSAKGCSEIEKSGTAEKDTS